MTVWLARHGEAEIRGRDDLRELTGEGARAFSALAHRIADRSGSMRVIHHSGLRRAEQTAEILAAATRVAMAGEPLDLLAPATDPFALSRWIESLSEPAVLVTHLPLVERVASVLISGSPEVPAVSFSPGTIVALDREDGSWKLAWIERP